VDSGLSFSAAAGSPGPRTQGRDAGAGGARGPAGGPAASQPGQIAEGALCDLIRSRIRDVPDFPGPGIVFKDITPLLADPAAFGAVVRALASGHGRVDKVAGIEARGFILAAPVACLLGAGFVPVRKHGKLPAATHAQTYDLEYGSATVEVHRDAFARGDRVLIVDDVLATGGTARATADLIHRAGGDVTAVAVLLEFGFLSEKGSLADLNLRPLLRV